MNFVFIFSSLSNFLDELKEETFNELLIRRLFVPFMFFCSTTRTKLLPRILIPKLDENRSWISIENFRQFAVPMIVDLFSYHVTSIRLTLLEYFQTYLHLIDQATLTNIVLPQVKRKTLTKYFRFHSSFSARLRFKRCEQRHLSINVNRFGSFSSRFRCWCRCWRTKKTNFYW